VQVYRYLDIGSSKPDHKNRELVKHHLIDIVDPDFRFTAGNFCRYAKESCDQIFKKIKFPLFVGGTPFYIDAFFKGLSEIPEIDDSIKKQIQLEFKERGIQYIYDELVKCDETFSKKIHFNDKQRILRGIEVFRGTGKSLSNYFLNKIAYESEETIYIGLQLDREILKKRIDQRVDSMIQSGLVDEVIHLRQMGYGPDLKSMQSIGYLEINKYLDGELELKDAIDKIKTETKRYAKRQMTWFRGNKNIQWVGSSDISKIKDIINNFLSSTHN
jgi:tRNA dimethylallyltransferase